VARWRAANQEWLTLRATAVGHLIAGDGVAAALVRAKAALVLAADAIDQEMAARKTAKRLGQSTSVGQSIVDKALNFVEPVDAEASAGGSGGGGGDE